MKLENFPDAFPVLDIGDYVLRATQDEVLGGADAARRILASQEIDPRRSRVEPTPPALAG